MLHDLLKEAAQPFPTCPYYDGGGVHVGGVSTLHDLLKEAAHFSPHVLTMMVVGST